MKKTKRNLLMGILLFVCSFNFANTYPYVVPKYIKDVIETDYKASGYQITNLRLYSYKYRIFYNDSLYTMKKDYLDKFYVVKVD